MSPISPTRKARPLMKSRALADFLEGLDLNIEEIMDLAARALYEHDADAADELLTLLEETEAFPSLSAMGAFTEDDLVHIAFERSTRQLHRCSLQARNKQAIPAFRFKAYLSMCELLESANSTIRQSMLEVVFASDYDWAHAWFVDHLDRDLFDLLVLSMNDPLLADAERKTALTQASLMIHQVIDPIDFFQLDPDKDDVEPEERLARYLSRVYGAGTYEELCL